MWRFLVALGGFTLLIGLLTIVFGSVIFVSTIGNALIATGAIGFTGGALIIAVAFVLKEVVELRLLVQAGATLASRSEPAAQAVASDIAEAAMLAVSQAVTPEPTFARRPPAPEPRLSRPEPAPEPVPAPEPEPEPAPEAVAAPTPPPVEAPAPRPRGLSFADRLRPAAKPPTPPVAPAPAAPTPRAEDRAEDDVPVVERRGRILSRNPEGEIAPPVPRPRSLLDRMSLGRPAAERPTPERITPEISSPAPRAPEPHEPEAHASEPHAPEPHAPEPAAEPHAPEPVPAPAHSEPAEPTPRPYGAPPPRPAPEPMVLKSGIVGGMAYTLYSDGSIQAELPDGVVRFASLIELREHVSRANAPE